MLESLLNQPLGLIAHYFAVAQDLLQRSAILHILIYFTALTLSHFVKELTKHGC
jgi:hypothetical protein